MTSAERILRLLLRLQRMKRGLTVGQLADQSGLSSKTVRRDLAVIRRAGFKLRATVDNDRGRKRYRVEP